MRASGLLGISALAVGLAVAPLSGQGFMIGGGAALPMGDFKDFAKVGWVGSAGVNFPLASKSLGIRVDANYSQNSSKVTGGGNVKLLNVLGGIQLGLGDKSSHPYVIGQAGYMKPTCDGCDGGAFAWAAGLGYTAGSVFVEGRYVSSSKDGGTTSVILAEIGFNFGGKK